MKNLNTITTEEIENYYNTTNHSQYECAKHFNISVGIFIKLLKERNIKKDKSKHTEAIKKAKLLKYGDMNYNNRDKSKQTCLKKYGVDNPFKDTKNIKRSYLEKLKVDHPMHNKEIKEKALKDRNYNNIWNKASTTYFNRTGFTNPSKNPAVIKKIMNSKIQHGCYDSPGTSNLERRFEKILNRKFKAVISRYRDIRYARNSGYMFECDFYIPEIDLFIELNGHPSHENHPYDITNKQDLDRVTYLRKSQKGWDKVLLETWTVRDVEKFNIAKQNNLNYIVLYPTNTIYNNKQFNNKKYSDLIEYLIKKLNKKE